jgi:small subunit ribosomal protein S25e
MAGGKTNTQKEKEKAKGATKKKPTIKDIISSKKAGGKGKKKKWSKSKSKEKLNNSVFWIKSAWDKCSKDIVAKEAYLTPSIISEKLKINVSLARAAIKQLFEEGKVIPYNGETHSRWGLFVKSPTFIKELEAKPVAAAPEKKEKKAAPKKA